jgi:hypothetical protein
MVLGVL